MRLIDADKLELKHYIQRVSDKVIRYNGTQPEYANYDILAHDIANAPTVKAIPLDKPFCKMVYEDYVCYNRNWLMKHLPMEVDILQGKAADAIPVEWIENYISKIKDDGMIYLSSAGCIKDMLKEWEKEK